MDRSPSITLHVILENISTHPPTPTPTHAHTHTHSRPHPQYTGHDCLRALIALYPPAMQLANDIDPVLDLDKVRAA